MEGESFQQQITQDSFPAIKDTASVRPAFRFKDSENLQQESEDVSGELIPVPYTGPNLFAGHHLKPKHPNARPVNEFVTDWFTISLIALVGLFTWFRYFNYRMFQQLVSAFFNFTVTNQIVRDESVLLQRAALILSVISYLLAGLFLYQVSLHYGWHITWMQKGMLRFGFFAVIIATAYSVKMILLRFMSTVFDIERPVAIYIFTVFLTVTMSGLILLPVNIILAYSGPDIREYTILGAAGLLAGLFIYRLIRAVGIWTGIPGAGFFYLFLYLCAFEIAPLLIIYKLVTLQL